METTIMCTLLLVFFVYTINKLLLPLYVSSLWTDAEIDIYDLIPFEIILKEEAFQKIAESKSPHIRKFLDSFIVKLHACHVMKLQDWSTVYFHLIEEIFRSMSHEGLLDISTEILTREALLKRAHLYESLDEEKRERFITFLSGGGGGNELSHLMFKKIQRMEFFKDTAERNAIIRDLSFARERFGGSLETIEVTLLRKLPKGRRPPKMTASAIFSGWAFNPARS